MNSKQNRKGEFLKVFEKALGNISIACHNCGIDRVTFYNWYREDEEFRAAADAVKEIRKDFIESALDQRIKEGDTTAIIFAAKTQCKDRGYVEKIETEQKVSATVQTLDEKKKELANIIDKLTSE